jgi:hypothetical protein
MKIVFNPAYRFMKTFVRNIHSCFENTGRIIYAERNTLKGFEEQGFDVCVKSFHRPFCLNRIIYGLFRPSKARRSFEYGMTLMERGISTPDPIAYVERKTYGMLQHSYYLSSCLKYDGMMREFRTGTLAGREDLLRDFARFVACMHEQQVFHKDFSPGNILYVKEARTYCFYLVDINRMAFRPVGMKKGCKNFKRMWGNEAMIRFVAREYALARHFDADRCEALTLKYHRRFWKRYSARHNGFLPYLETSDR